MCVHFCKLQKQQLFLNSISMAHKFQSVVKLNFLVHLGPLFDSKLSFIPHITSLKNRCTKSLDLIKVLSNTTWGADRKVLLSLYRCLIRSKLDYVLCMVLQDRRI